MFLESFRVWFATWKANGRAWLPGQRGLHGLRGKDGVLQKEMCEWYCV